MILYHGGTDVIETPVIRSRSGGRDFGMGFYCTDIRVQAEKWARRQGRIRKLPGVLNKYEFDFDCMRRIDRTEVRDPRVHTSSLQGGVVDFARHNLSVKLFKDYSHEWLELALNCRKNIHYIHGFDIVFGKIANDDVGETIQAVLDGFMPFDFALQKLAFMPSNNQYCFCTERSLAKLFFIEAVEQE